MPVWRSIEFYLGLWGDKFMPVRRQVSTLCLCSGWIVNFYLRLCGGRLCLCGGRFAVICFCLACVAVSCEYFFSPVWRWAIACVAVKLRVLFSPGWRWVPACVVVSCSFFYACVAVNCECFLFFTPVWRGAYACGINPNGLVLFQFCFVLFYLVLHWHLV